MENGVDILIKDRLKQTPMYYAARDGKIEVIKFLMCQGVNIDNIDIYGQNAIYYAISRGHLDICRLMKQYGSNHDMADQIGQTPIFYAIQSDKIDALQWLLSIGCNVNTRDQRGATPISTAMRHKKFACKELLVKHGAVDRNLVREPANGQNTKIPRPKVPQQSRPRVNDRLVPKEYVLQVYDGEQYRPITQQEFQALASEHPEIAKLFTDES